MVVEIDGNYEVIFNLHDVSEIVKKYYNKDLALELERLVEEQEKEIERLENELEYEY